jgi:transcriptional regulator with PAS, ATPase and Fis domain
MAHASGEICTAGTGEKMHNLGVSSSSAGCAARQENDEPKKGRFIGKSLAITTIKDAVSTIAHRQSTVLILGETGTGKEVLANYFHDLSTRRTGPFIPVDCSSLSDTLIESELFGHVRGAFTGALQDSLGFIRSADGGTLFLDEIGELSLPLQAKLLRVVQERTVVPVGSAKRHPVDIRIVAATHRDLAEMVKLGTFRQDLYFRINVIAINLPPLRERLDDVLPLAEHFLKAQAELYEEPVRDISPEAAHLLLQYNWPGNVRELANVMEHAHVLCNENLIQPGDLPPRLQEAAGDSSGTSEFCLRDMERRLIGEALRHTNNCKSAASRLLGINIQKLNRRIKNLNLQ